VPLWLLIVLASLATYRVTRFIATDEFPLVAEPRDAFVNRWATKPNPQTRVEKRVALGGQRTNLLMRSVAYLWECEWCLGVWVSGGVTYGTWRLTTLGAQPVWIGALVWLTAAAVTGMIAQREPH
jgi:hypothetical protein